MEYISGAHVVDEADANMDGLDDATGAPDPMAAGAAPMDPGTGGAAMDPTMAGGAAMDPTMAGGAAAGGAAAGQGVPGFNPQDAAIQDPDNPGSQESFDEAIPDDQQGDENSGEDEEVIDVDELVDSQEKNEKAIDKLTDKFEHFIEKFSEFQGELKANSEFMSDLKNEFEKRNPSSVEKLTMRSLQSKPFSETPEEYMEYDAPENYSPEDDMNGVGEPRYTITRDDVRNATDYASIAKTLRDNENATLKTLLGL